MTHVVTEACIRCKYTDCVDVCPVDCFREGPNFLTIDPDECIDCAVCIPECPVNAIVPEEDLAPEQRHMIALNAELARAAGWPTISLRAYSIVSANYEEHLEFLSIKVPDGPLTSKLQHIKPGDKIVVGRKPTGTLLIDYLLPGKNLYLLGSGTGLAPFLSIVRDPETYARFEKVIIVHGVREVAELAYRETLTRELPQHEFLGEMVSRQMLYYPTVTREAFENQGRITTLLETGKLQADLGLPAMNPVDDRVMICGSPGLLKDLKHLLDSRGFKEGSTTSPGDFVIERAFVEQ